MSVVHLVRCEQYSECQHEFSFDPTCGRPTQYASENWITLFIGDLQTHTGHHFCSVYCLAKWAMERLKASASEDEETDWLTKLTQAPYWSVERLGEK